MSVVEAGFEQVAQLSDDGSEQPEVVNAYVYLLRLASSRHVGGDL
jgi:hypothetical protein